MPQAGLIVLSSNRNESGWVDRLPCSLTLFSPFKIRRFPMLTGTSRGYANCAGSPCSAKASPTDFGRYRSLSGEGRRQPRDTSQGEAHHKTRSRNRAASADSCDPVAFPSQSSARFRGIAEILRLSRSLILKSRRSFLISNKNVPSPDSFPLPGVEYQLGRVRLS